MDLVQARASQASTPPSDIRSEAENGSRVQGPTNSDDVCKGEGWEGTHDPFRLDGDPPQCRKFYVPTITEASFINGKRRRCDSDYENSHDPRPWSLQGAFRFTDLPLELRYKIYELLLVRGNVALTKEFSIQFRYGFRWWKHSRPKWNLLWVNRQMREEASNVLYSAKNTFYLPLKDFQENTPTRYYSPSLPLPNVKRLDCAFDMTDTDVDNYAIFEEAKWSYDYRCQNYNDGTMVEFEKLDVQARWGEIHNQQIEYLEDIWRNQVYACLGLGLDFLRLDLRNCRCPTRCCRLGRTVCTLFIESVVESTCPKRIEILGALDPEEETFRGILATGFEASDGPISWVFPDQISFVDKSGCDCQEDQCCDSSHYIETVSSSDPFLARQETVDRLKSALSSTNAVA